MGKLEHKGRQAEETVSAYIKKFHMIEADERVLVGLSGGADSVCLFCILLALREKFDFTLEAVHVNHCLRDTADRDEAFVRSLCAREDVVLHTYTVDVGMYADEKGMSTEEAARELRYQCFEDAMKKTGAFKVAVAHHKNDQAETILFHICRGSGPDGLSGMRPVRDFVIRPILCLSREQIEQYLSACSQEYVTDETNKSTLYSRNRLRLEVLPVLEEICPGAGAHIASAGENMAQLSGYLREEICRAMAECVEWSGQDGAVMKLSCQRLAGLHPYLQGEVVRECLFAQAGQKKDISRIHVESVLGLTDMQVGRKLDLPYGIEAEKSYDTLLFRKKDLTGEKETEFCVEVSIREIAGEKEILLPDGKRMRLRRFAYERNAQIPTKAYTKWLDCDKIGEVITIRPPQESDFFYFNNKNKKYVKDYMVNEKIPKENRNRSILVTEGDHMLYFVGRRVSNAVLIDETTKNILEITVTGG